ncbi:hypothetical protein [Domibacillus tundrae]|uniref:hypothetical protein n=1 Tax=Domibacillus tundrae TaxID=1587527 RepID=UPI0006180826|nr:hypothetical protein [Domibacillus tundrae]
MIRKEKLIPLLQVTEDIREKYSMLKFPNEEAVNQAVDYLSISSSDLYFNSNGESAPFLYYKSIVIIELPRQLDIEELELNKTKRQIKQTHASLQQFINRNEWKRLFLFIDQRILAPAFDELFDEIPKEQLSEVLSAIQKRLGRFPVLRNEKALQMIADQLI